MNRRDLLKYIGIAPLAAWLSSRAEPAKASAAPAEPQIRAWTTTTSIQHLVDSAPPQPFTTQHLTVFEPPPQLDFMAPVPQMREWLGPKSDKCCESPRTANYGGPDDEPALFAQSHPPAPRECWGKDCQSYGKPHLTPWECSIKLRITNPSAMQSWRGTGRA